MDDGRDLRVIAKLVVERQALTIQLRGAYIIVLATRNVGVRGGNEGNRARVDQKQRMLLAQGASQDRQRRRERGKPSRRRRVDRSKQHLSLIIR
jgi:hypothetical protein